MKRLLISTCMVALSFGCSTQTDDIGKLAALSHHSTHEELPGKAYFIGQDLDSVRGYFNSNCCSSPDGVTAYLSLYRLLDGADFGGLGFGPDLEILSPEGNWGAGNVGAWQSANEFGAPHLAIGLFIAENQNPNGLKQIADGELDAEIDHLARFMTSVKGQVLLRIGYEFDGAWNVGQGDTKRYIAAYQHIVDRINNSGATNVQFVWQTGASIIDDLIEQSHENIAEWYPGDEYVDWVAVSWFLNPDEAPTVGGYEPHSSRQLADEALALARQYKKPLLIAESAPQGIDINEGFMANITPLLDGPSGENREDMTNDEIWERYYAPLFAWMNENSDTVKGLAYINADWDSQDMWGPPYDEGFWGDSRLETNADLASRFNAEIANWRTE